MSKYEDDGFEVLKFKRIISDEEYYEKTILKKNLEDFIIGFNHIVSKINLDDYKTKQHLIDEWDSYTEGWVKKYDLNFERGIYEKSL